MWRLRKAAICKPRRAASEETNSAHTLISDSEPPELSENTLLVFKARGLWYFVAAALTHALIQPGKHVKPLRAGFCLETSFLGFCPRETHMRVHR